ncbi:hypothetical protein CHH75_22085 [Paenibacillus sp. 7541]|uniref:Uncharacterized protein n=1 Tax=Paenibacillus campinasensis TaxID=66347 RepID=A0A268EGG3_9BACL|nr:hypothetical protein CHH67_22825 [Paenibacillus campinasensis]PAK48750.1 hypothetical protein CHH75_22085 [Paenibacillus sp. 7541]
MERQGLLEGPVFLLSIRMSAKAMPVILTSCKFRHSFVREFMTSRHEFVKIEALEIILANRKLMHKGKAKDR